MKVSQGMGYLGKGEMEDLNFFAVIAICALLYAGVKIIAHLLLVIMFKRAAWYPGKKE